MNSLASIVKWVSPLANVKLYICDERTPGPMSGTGRLDTISFVLDGRRWLLRDRTVGTSNPPSREEQRSALITASLETDAQNGDTPEDIEAVVRDICRLLSFALARNVAVVELTGRDAGNKPVHRQSLSGYLAPYGHAFHAPVDNFEPGCLRRFIEKAWPVLRADSEWFGLTLEYLLLARTNPFVEIRSVVLNILVDRIASRLQETSGKHEIDDTLKKKMREPIFQEKLESVFKEITPNWTSDRTHALIGIVNGWNSEPSFVVSICRACQRMRLPEPTKEFLKTRHLLLHEGDLKPKEGTVVKYWLELDWLLISLLLRMFDYAGLVYHTMFGPSPVRLADKMTSTAT